MQEKIILLETVKKELKEEFVGIDYQIDQLINFIKPWFLYRDKQTFPTIINLWGMTGVGKSELISSLVKKLDLSHLYSSFDMAPSYHEDDGTLYYKFDKMSYMYDTNTPIIVFDDIQYAAIRNQYNIESNSNKSFIWKFIDTGETVSMYNSSHSSIKEFIKFLEEIQNRGIELNKNIIPEENYSEYFDLLLEYDYGSNINITKRKTISLKEKRKSFIYDEFLRQIKIHHRLEYRKLLENRKKEYSIKEIIDILTKHAILDLKPKVYDLRKSLIFVIGNLDQLYTMSFEFEKIPADMLYDITSKITIKNIKDALLTYFNPEHIARLGHNHIIYYSFKREDYIKVIKKLLSEIKLIEFKYSDNFVDFLYDKFVFPTQGMRIKKNIKQYVEELIISELLEENTTSSSLDYDKENNNILLFKNDQWIIKPYISDSISIDKNIKYITSIHEAAHAVVNIIDTKLIPKYIALQDKDADSLGLTFTEYPDHESNKKLILSKIKCYLAGPISEKIFFGSENISTGTASDISSATNLAALIYKHGLNDDLIYVQNKQESEYAYSSIKEQNKEIRKIIKECSKETEKLIKDYKQLVELIAEKLFENTLLLSEDVINILQENGYETELSEVKSKDAYFDYLPEKFKKKIK